MKTVMIISDATGETAERMVRAATLQFSEPVQIRLYSRVRLESELEQILEKAAEQRALVVFTVVNAEERGLISSLVERYNIETVDLIGALISKLAMYLGAAPAGVPGLLHSVNDEYFRRIEAVEFAVKSDDGKEPRNFKKADLVLIGVSRTSKTPLSTILAQRGLKVANLPLVLGVPPPLEVEEAPQDRIVGLTIGLDQLCAIRQARLRQLGMPSETNYALREHVRQELDFAQQLFRAHPQWPVIDVTGRAIEETAVIILETIKERDERAKAAHSSLI